MTIFTRFYMTDEHLALLRHMCVSWDDAEYGAPSIDPKRPYGNSDVPGDIREILDNDRLTDNECRELHENMKAALQVALASGQFERGDYESDPYRDNWRRRGD